MKKHALIVALAALSLVAMSCESPFSGTTGATSVRRAKSFQVSPDASPLPSTLPSTLPPAAPPPPPPTTPPPPPPAVNTAPVVTLAPTAAVTLPLSLPLAATVTDDGMPGPLTYAWSKVSGPGTVTFSAPAQTATTASFSLAGSYVLQLQATDGVLSTSARVTVTVNPAVAVNVAPLVNAGADQTITLPATATLAGMASDDGLPNPPAALTYQWVKISGPGTVTFSSSTSRTPTASFSLAGVYVLELQASDSLLSGSDRVQITANAANQAPVANAGAAQTITLPATAILSATGSTDDGLPNPPAKLIYAWTQVSGPGTATLSTPTSVTTAAAFPVAGSYVFRVTVSDSVLSSTAQVTITVNAAVPATAGVFQDRCTALQPSYAAPATTPPIATSRDIYVDGQSGNDANTGLSMSSPWKSLSKLQYFVRAGDTIHLMGTFVDQSLTPKASGTATAQIIYKSEPTKPAIFTYTSAGAGLTPFSLSGVNYLVFDGIQAIQNSGADGIYMLGANYNWFRNIKLTAGTNRIYIGIKYNRFEDSTFNSVNGSLFFIRDGVYKNVFARNIFSAGAFTFGNNNFNTESGPNAPAGDNEFFDNEFVNRNDGAISITGNMHRTLFQCNRIHDSGADKISGFQNGNLNQPEGGGGPAFHTMSSNNVIRYNTFYNNKWEVMTFESVGDCTNPAGAVIVQGNLVQHNVFYGNGGPSFRLLVHGPGASQCNGVIPYYGDIKNNRFENNIWWMNSNFCDFHYCDVYNKNVWGIIVDFYHTQLDNWPSGDKGMNGNVIRNNFVGRDAARTGLPWFGWGAYSNAGARSYTLAQAQTAFPSEILSNTEKDPLFVNALSADFTLQPLSPAIDFGVPITGLSSQGAAPDAGRYELVP